MGELCIDRNALASNWDSCAPRRSVDRQGFSGRPLTLSYQVQLSHNEQIQLLEQLNPSHKATQSLRRAICTPGTRRYIIQIVKAWADDICNNRFIYWLFGPVGTGKSTIAYTIIQLYKLTRGPGDNIVFGASFFCSRQSEETRTVSRIIPTIVYQLAFACKAFADAFNPVGTIGMSMIAHQGPAAQLRHLLVDPWKQSHAARVANNDPTYLVGIDALDELDAEGGSVFLRALLEVQGELEGLKFLVTSREDPALVAYSKNLAGGQICHLQDAPLAEVNADVKSYFVEQLGHVANDAEIDQLVIDSAGLFIYAATVVEHIGVLRRPAGEQRTLLKRLLNVSCSTNKNRSASATTMLDKLYLQIVEEALNPNDLEEDLFQNRLDILHTFLSTIERTSPSVVAQLLSDGDTPTNRIQDALDDSVVNYVLEGLHAVLYVQDGRVMWFHKSFPDFVFNQGRSGKFYCNQGDRHQFLAERCFEIMLQHLRFNIADIPTSFIFDRHNPTLEASVEGNIGLVLRYTCRSWSHHLREAPVAGLAQVFQHLHSFLRLPVLFWIETMNLLGHRGLCEGMLRETQKTLASLQVRFLSLWFRIPN
jgi:hypothetical protein